MALGNDQSYCGTNGHTLRPGGSHKEYLSGQPNRVASILRLSQRYGKDEDNNISPETREARLSAYPLLNVIERHRLHRSSVGGSFTIWLFGAVTRSL